MLLQITTEKELIEMVSALKKECDRLTALNKSMAKDIKSIIDKKPAIEVREIITKEVEKPTIKNTTVIQTDASVLPTLKKLSDRIKALEEDKKQPPLITNKTIVETDKSVFPTLKKLSDRVKILEGSKPEKQIIKELTTHEVKTVDAASKKEIEALKKSISEIKPTINNIIQGVSDNDVLSLINKHVTINYVNKLYKRAK